MLKFRRKITCAFSVFQRKTKFLNENLKSNLIPDHFRRFSTQNSSLVRDYFTRSILVVILLDKLILREMKLLIECAEFYLMFQEVMNAKSKKV